MTTYNVTYALPEHAETPIPEGLDTDVSLRDVIGTCRDYSASARLYDAAGFQVGAVNTHGDYRLE